MSGTKILFLEDDKLYQETIKDLLEEESFIVDTCSNGQEFLNKIFNTIYDLYILDLNVPQIDGFEIMNILREYQDETMRLVLSSIPDSTKRSFRSGCDGFLNKNTHIEELLLRVRTLIKRSYRTYHDFIPISNSYTYDIFNKRIYHNSTALEIESQALFILDYLIKKRGQFVSKVDLEKNVYPSNSESKSAVIRYHIWSIRKIIGFDLIESQKNRGYRLKPKGI
ncbi:MAG: response regulator transcription factor [Candidatus Marinarcus sp.]|uniref:response regulator transcription factor n=1 Tax=Candidatus Marinarcus sp. TaxID=3100987 RepID=UPI003AFFD2A2